MNSVSQCTDLEVETRPLLHTTHTPLHCKHNTAAATKLSTSFPQAYRKKFKD